MTSSPEDVIARPIRRRRRRRWIKWLVATILLSVVAFAVVGEIVIRRAGPIVKGRVIETLSTRFNSRVELGRLDVSLLRGLQVSGDGLTIYPPQDVVAAGATNPIISIRHFAFHASLGGLFIKPTRVGTVYVTGLEIHIPPRQARQGSPSTYRRRGKIKIDVDHILFEHSQLIIDNGNPTKEPKKFDLQRIELDSTGLQQPWQYGATLVNAIPRGNIRAFGRFGPWNEESPGDSLIDGHYLFDHADLNPIKGIGGVLSSVGDFRGQLNRIDVTGTTETPDFSLDTANQPLPLHTRFHALVDGTTGDTVLDPVEARLRNSAFTCRGSIVNIKGQGHVIDLDLDIPDAYLQDFLALAVKTRPVVMTAHFSTRARLHIRPGKESVMQKVAMKSAFTLRRIHFNNPKLQDKLDDLSLRAQGRPAEAKPGAPAVSSQMTGRFVLSGARMNFSDLEYDIPGAKIALTGIYSLDGEQFDFHGNVRTEAKLSQMVSSWWKQLLLKPVDPFFSKNGAGTQIPIAISGTKSDPKFGLDFGHDNEKRQAPAAPHR